MTDSDVHDLSYQLWLGKYKYYLYCNIKDENHILVASLIWLDNLIDVI